MNVVPGLSGITRVGQKKQRRGAQRLRRGSRSKTQTTVFSALLCDFFAKLCGQSLLTLLYADVGGSAVGGGTATLAPGHYSRGGIFLGVFPLAHSSQSSINSLRCSAAHSKVIAIARRGS